MTSSSHEQAIEPGEPGYLMDIPSSTFLDGMKILDALANEDAVNLFFYTEKGNVSSKEAMEALGLSQKRFYTRLKLLLDAGLLEKKEEGYQHTFLGTLVYKLGLSLLNIVEKKEQIDIINSIIKSRSITTDKTSQITSALSIEMPFALTSDLRGVLSPVKMIDSYDNLAEEITKFIEKSKSSIYLATKYTDVRVVEAAMSAFDRGITFKILIEEIDLSQSIQAIRLLISPKKLRQFINFTKKLKNIIKKCNTLPYSFMVIDNKITVIEVPHPLKNKFQLAFVFENTKVGKNLIKIFKEIWEKSEF